MALLGVMHAHKLSKDKEYELKGGWQRHLDGDADFTDWFEVPQEKISTKDAFWGHEVQRVPTGDWLDKHVQTVKEIKDWVPPALTAKQ